MLRPALATILAALALAAPAAADWSGDGPADVLAVHPDGRLLLYRGTGAGAFQPSGGQGIGSGWGGFDALLTGDWSGDGKPDILARTASDGRLLMYRGNGSGGFATGAAEQIGSGWGPFTALLLPRDWDGDGKPDILARDGDGRLLMYRGNGAGGFITGRAEQIGAGWGPFTALLAPGDWSGDGTPTSSPARADGALLLYRGDGQGGFARPRPDRLGLAVVHRADGRRRLQRRRQAGHPRPRRGRAAADVPRRRRRRLRHRRRRAGRLGLAVARRPDAELGPARPATTASPAAARAAPARRQRELQAGIRCTPPGGRLKVNLKVRKRSGRKAPRVRRVVFFIRGGARKTDRKRPYVVKLRVRRPGGLARARLRAGRVHARRLEEAAPQDGLAALRHVRLTAVALAWAQATPASISSFQISPWSTTSTSSFSALVSLLAPTSAPVISMSVLAETELAVVAPARSARRWKTGRGTFSPCAGRRSSR